MIKVHNFLLIYMRTLKTRSILKRKFHISLFIRAKKDESRTHQSGQARSSGENIRYINVTIAFLKSRNYIKVSYRRSSATNCEIITIGYDA